VYEFLFARRKEQGRSGIEENASKTEEKMESQRAGFIVRLTFLFFLAAFPVQAGEPKEQLGDTMDKVLKILQDPGPKSEDKTMERRRRLRQIISERFDFAEMAKRSLGQQWGRRSPKEQEEFVKLFTDLLEESYVKKIESYNGEKVLYTREKKDSGSAEIDTKIVTKKGEEFAVNYKLHPVGEQWKVYDVVIENISLVNNYRSQFNRILANSSYEDLVQKMKEKRFAAPASKEKS
jgi:phospholipid transport system substrate-binding protein